MLRVIHKKAKGQIIARWSQCRLGLEVSFLRYLITRYQFDFIFRDEFQILTCRPVTDNLGYILSSGNSCDAAPLIRFLENANYEFDISFDVGANIGVVTTFLSTRSNVVYAFEPEPQNVARLYETLKLNHIKNARVEEIALSDRNGDTELFVLSSYGHHSLGNVKTSNFVKSIPIRCMSIDDFCLERRIGKIDCLKIDVEGFESEVLMGARSMLAEGKIHLILFEISRVPLHSLGKKPDDVISILHEMGYSVHSLDGSLVERDLTHVEHEDFYAIRK